MAPEYFYNSNYGNPMGVRGNRRGCVYVECTSGFISRNTRNMDHIRPRASPSPRSALLSLPPGLPARGRAARIEGREKDIPSKMRSGSA